MSEDWLAARVRATPDALALVIDEQQWSYSEINAEVAHYTHGLTQAGIRPGQHIAVLLPNDLPYLCLIHALARLGAVLVPLNTRLTAAELHWQIEQSDCQWLIHDDGFATVVAALDELQNCTAINATALPTSGLRTSGLRTSGLRTSGLHENCENATSAEVSLPTHNFQLNAPQAIVFTSGTTGRPKGAVLTFANHFWGATASSYRLGLSPADRWLSCLPLYHVGGLAVVFRSCLYGTAIVLHPRFDLEPFSRSLDRDQITLTSVVPTMLHRLLEYRQGQAWPDSLRHILLGGAAATAKLLAAARATGAPVATTYGLTEAASQVATMRPEDVRRKPGSVGKPLMFSSVRIADEDGNTLPPGKKGEVVVSGPTVMAGYYKNEDATSQTIRNGELYTGDIGYLDDEGDLWLVQRRSELIVSGGENVYPAEVEAVLRQHPAVADTCVVGIPDAEWGERVAALVELIPGTQVTTDELIDHCRQSLARYKHPRLIQFTDALPQTASGKIERRTVIDTLAQT